MLHYKSASGDTYPWRNCWRTGRRVGRGDIVILAGVCPWLVPKRDIGVKRGSVHLLGSNESENKLGTPVANSVFWTEKLYRCATILVRRAAASVFVH